MTEKQQKMKKMVSAVKKICKEEGRIPKAYELARKSSLLSRGLVQIYFGSYGYLLVCAGFKEDDIQKTERKKCVDCGLFLEKYSKKRITLNEDKRCSDCEKAMKTKTFRQNCCICGAVIPDDYKHYRKYGGFCKTCDSLATVRAKKNGYRVELPKSIRAILK